MERETQEPGREPADAKPIGEVVEGLVETLGPVAVDETTGPARANNLAGTCILYGRPFELHAARPKREARK